jgi:hypothetical protein
MLPKLMLKDSDDGLYSELLSLWTFFIVRYKKAKILKLLRFEIWFWFRPEVKKCKEGGWGVINLISWVPIEWANPVFEKKLPKLFWNSYVNGYLCSTRR